MTSPSSNTAKSNNLIVVTCASGRQNSYLLPHLASASDTSLRLLVNSKSSQSSLQKAYPSAEVICADLRQPAALVPMLENATHVYHVGPGFHPHETQLGYNVIDAAIAESKRDGNRFRHFVYSSVLNTQLRKLLNHDGKRYVEEYLIESGLNWTILSPTNFMNREILMMLYQQAGREEGKPALFGAPWNPDIKFSMVALPDLGEAGAKVIIEGQKHYMAQYQMVSSPLTSYREFVQLVGDVIGRKIEVKRKAYEDAVDGFAKMAIGADADQKAMDGAQRIILYYNNCKLGDMMLRAYFAEQQTDVSSRRVAGQFQHNGMAVTEKTNTD